MMMTSQVAGDLRYYTEKGLTVCRKVSERYRKAAASCRKVSYLYRKGAASCGKVSERYRKTAASCRRVSYLYRKSAASCGRVTVYAGGALQVAGRFRRQPESRCKLREGSGANRRAAASCRKVPAQRGYLESPLPTSLRTE